MSAVPTSKQKRIFQTLNNLVLLPRVSIIESDDDLLSEIRIEHPQEYVPNFKLEWCPGKEHYRVYIHVAHTTYHKRNAGYCICTISNGLAAIGFGVLYAFLHKHRANNRSEAVD